MIAMTSFPNAFKALVIGSGAIGTAFIDILRATPHGSSVELLSRHSQPAIDFDQENSIADAAQALLLAKKGPFHLIVNAVGILHSSHFMPEKKLADINYDQILTTFQTNTFGPAMVIRHFSKLLDKEKAVMVFLSAKVGSIEDNKLGGWYSYRASKAALNMILKTASIELKRTQPYTTLIAMHPSTVNSALSQPFRGMEIGRSAHDAVEDMLKVINAVTPADTGRFYAYNGEILPW